MNNRLKLLFLLCVISMIVLLVTGCTNGTENETPLITPNQIPTNDTTIPITTTSIYKTYEMKADDIRLRYLEYPLFTFEYPGFFNLIDLNPVPGHFTPNAPPMDYDISDVSFTGEYVGYHRQSISIYIVTPDYLDMLNTNNMLEYYLSEWNSITDDITIEEISVAGISADYLKAVEVSGGLQTTLRVAIFDYAGLTWEIQMFWYTIDLEPPEIEEYFNHVIETFEFLD